MNTTLRTDTSISLYRSNKKWGSGNRVSIGASRQPNFYLPRQSRQLRQPQYRLQIVFPGLLAAAKHDSHDIKIQKIIFLDPGCSVPGSFQWFTMTGVHDSRDLKILRYKNYFNYVFFGSRLLYIAAAVKNNTKPPYTLDYRFPKKCLQKNLISKTLAKSIAG